MFNTAGEEDRKSDRPDEWPDGWHERWERKAHGCAILEKNAQT
jgi:hypothetical protein